MSWCSSCCDRKAWSHSLSSQQPSGGQWGSNLRLQVWEGGGTCPRVTCHSGTVYGSCCRSKVGRFLLRWLYLTTKLADQHCSFLGPGILPGVEHTVHTVHPDILPPRPDDLVRWSVVLGAVERERIDNSNTCIASLVCPGSRMSSSSASEWSRNPL